MTDDQEPIMLSDVKRLVLNPGDTIVITCDRPLHSALADHIKQRIREELGDYPVLVLAGGIDIGVIAAE